MAVSLLLPMLLRTERTEARVGGAVTFHTSGVRWVRTSKKIGLAVTRCFVLSKLVDGRLRGGKLDVEGGVLGPESLSGNESSDHVGDGVRGVAGGVYVYKSGDSEK